MTEQSSSAAERSAHVLRGPAVARALSDPFVGPPLGPVRLRAVVEVEARVEAARRVLGYADVLTRAELVEALEDALGARA
jgi:hypothetical protein